MIVTYIMTSRDRQKVYRDRLKLGDGREEPFHFPVIGSGRRVDLGHPRSIESIEMRNREVVFTLIITNHIELLMCQTRQSATFSLPNFSEGFWGYL